MSGKTTRIAKSTKDRITIRGEDLVDDLIGERTYTEMLHFLCAGEFPSKDQIRMLDACLVTLMEHGWTPSSIVARMVSDSVPGEMQVPMAAGLLAVGSVFAGTSEACAELLLEARDVGEPRTFFREIIRKAREAKTPLPGFGHPLHKPDDPRAAKLIALAREVSIGRDEIALLEMLSEEIDTAFGKHITINATGAIGAVLLGLGYSPDVMRGMAVVSRSAGLVGHIIEEREIGTARGIWQYVEESIPYE